MKFIVSVLLTALLSFAAGLYTDWWTLALCALLVAALIHQKPWKAWLSAFIGIFLLWAILSWWIDVRNESILSKKIATLIPLDGSTFLLITCTAFIGALVGGVLSIIYSVLLYVFGDHSISQYGDSYFELHGIGVLLITIIPWLLLLPVIEAFNNGQTLGKTFLGIRVLRQNGSEPEFGNIIVRHLLDFIDYFPFFGITGLIVASNNPNKQRVGDLVAKTIVIDIIK